LAGDSRIPEILRPLTILLHEQAQVESSVDVDWFSFFFILNRLLFTLKHLTRRKKEKKNSLEHGPILSCIIATGSIEDRFSFLLFFPFLSCSISM